MPHRRPAFAASAALAATAFAQPVQVGFLWHMHQPRYVPGLSVFDADAAFSFSVVDVHNSRFGPYTTWPRDAVAIGSGMPHLGAQVSFSGSLTQNLNELQAAGVNAGLWSNWNAPWRQAQSSLTTLGNRRLELVAFGYHHPLMPLLDDRSIRRQIQLQRHVYGQTWQSAFSRGMFPPETAFSTRIIPALVAEGIDWVLVDNIHFDRACEGYPHTDATGIPRPNRADQINPDPASTGGRWLQLQNLWAPSRVSVPFGYQPHYAQHVDPATGQAQRMIVVPAARYEGNEDGRGGYGAFLYDGVMDAYLQDNNAADRPMLVVLHHDGDNFGGGSEAYYHGNFQNMVNWASADPDYDVTTVADYLERFPVPHDDLIHVADGSWAGADAGDPEFKKWLGGDVSPGGQSPDLNSWAVLLAATNYVYQLDDAFSGVVNLQNVINNSGSANDRAWFWLLTGQASDYWYWDGTEVWDSNVTVAANAAVAQAESFLASSAAPDTTPPAVFVPQREPYNPGGVEFGATVQPSDFEVWTLAHDRAGLASVTLHYRLDADGRNPLASTQNETYAGGPEVGPWIAVPMTASDVPTPLGVTHATHKARRFGAMITGQQDALLDYFVEAVDAHGNLARSAVMHVYVGDASGGNNGGGNDPATAAVSPDPAVAGQSVTILYDAAGGPLAAASRVFLHHGFNGWQTVITPDTPMTDDEHDGVWEATVQVPQNAAALDIVFNNGAGTWDNNAGQDWHFPVQGAEPPAFTIDGNPEPGLAPIATRNGVSLYAAIDGTTLYLATNPPSDGLDRFIVLAQNPATPRSAMWAKAGTVAEWDAFVGAEASNAFAGWFDNAAAASVARGQLLEASIDLAEEFGTVPVAVSVAVLGYASPDGGALDASRQLPAGNGNGNVEDPEFIELSTCVLRGDCCAADLAADFGVLNVNDIITFVNAFNAQASIADLAADFGVLNVNDVITFVNAFNAGCP